MHIPDNILDWKTCVTLGVVSGGILVAALRGFKHFNVEQRVPLIGVTAAFIFAAQMLNFPVPDGTSGHFLGGVLACILLGPWTGFIAMSMVLIVQSLLFGDGGITALGANIFNMGLMGSVGGFGMYGFFRLILWGDRTRPLAYALAAWCSIMLAAFFCALELAISGRVPLTLALAAMLGVHAIIGLVEAFITTTALMTLWRLRPDLLKLPKY